MDATSLAARRAAARLQVLDVREPAEWDMGHIDGAVNVPLGELDERGEQLDRTVPVVTVCRSGERSSTAATALRAAGFDAENLDGGLAAWTAEGLPLLRSDGSPGHLAEPPEPQPNLHNLLLELAQGLQAEFGDREPTEEEERQFLRERMRKQGKTAAEIDAILNDL
ncbi:MAG: rhodanese-like domain-containing protein [Actinomycetota bacterium]|nr:rhodanese-like domain-containing protein [Actinomycetota bacterium]